MGMRALFECDECGVKKVLRGNISTAVDFMEAKGWTLGSQVFCSGCALTEADALSASGDSDSDDITQDVQREEAPRIEVHSDGSTIGSNPGYGGWGWTNGKQSGCGPALEHPSTNQRMEILAAVEALRNNADPVLLCTDSSYVANCVNKKWYVGWQRNGWVNRAKEPVKNRDLWEQLVDAMKAHPNLEVRWVKGHNGNPLNERADGLARGAAEANRARLTGRS